MRVVIQRVSKCNLSIDGSLYSSIGKGLLVLVGIENDDNQEDINWLVKKIVQLRIFDDSEGVMNLSVQDIKGEIMLVSQFTLHASCKKGNRPSYIRSAAPEISMPLFEMFVKTMQKNCDLKIATGKFGANMSIELVNEGPVTILIDSKNKE